MPLELGVWRIDGGVRAVDFGGLDLESRLEDILDGDLSIASPHWMVVGRQVQTPHGKFIDLLAVDRDGRLIVLELKRDRTPRDVVAQLLDYGSWVRTLRNDDVIEIYTRYVGKYHPGRAADSIEEAFRARFGTGPVPDEFGAEHELVVVAASLDDGTERVVQYLADEYGAKINALFFRVFRDDGREYLSRAWLREPTSAPALAGVPGGGTGDGPGEPWNGETYVSYSADRSWDDAVRYGFVSAGGGAWYSRSLALLEPGQRVWVNIPGGTGYVGVGTVTVPAVRADEFLVAAPDGGRVPITDAPTANPAQYSVSGEAAEHVVGIEWIKTLPTEQAVREKGLFGNQNSAARPTAAKWRHTVERLKSRFGVA